VKRYGGGVASDESTGRGEDVQLTNLDQPLFDGAQATKRDLVEYLEAAGEQLLGELRDRPLSVMRAVRGQKRVRAGARRSRPLSGGAKLNLCDYLADYRSHGYNERRQGRSRPRGEE
jgi:hypothetical protein